MALIPPISSLSYRRLCYDKGQDEGVENKAPSRSLAFLQACAGTVGVLLVSPFGEAVFWGGRKNDWSCGDQPEAGGGSTEVLEGTHQLLQTQTAVVTSPS